ncbi:MAG TPA: DUF1844 domain-containing protein [Bryobacteraceae bacterium]|nr:DUF1844 domain-containing protein [Bryobacteraceae bacterium]
MSATDFPLPPATFEFLVLSLKMQVEMRLFGGDSEDDHGPDLMAARHAIDLLAMISEKTRGNLTIEEQRLIENSLTELRFRYVQAVEDAAKSAGKAKAAAAPEPSADAESADEPKSE